MKTIMKLEDLTTIDQLTDFLSGTQVVAFSVISDKDAGAADKAADLGGWKSLYRQLSDSGG